LEYAEKDEKYSDGDDIESESFGQFIKKTQYGQPVS
jgi:hypothetical protein